MKKILILQMRPEDETADAEFKAILDKGGIKKDDVIRLRVEQNNHPEFNLDNISAIIAGGSPFDLSTPQKDKTEIQINVESFFQDLLNQIIPKDKAFLGACSGNGLLGKYCGTSISKKYGEPIGPVEVKVTEEGEADDLLKGLPSDFEVLVGHKEACDSLPEGATLLATSESCPVQMFRIKNNIYATQFHPEADEEQFCLRIDIYKNFGYFKPEESDALKAKLIGVSTPFSNQILKRFVDKYSR